MGGRDGLLLWVMCGAGVLFLYSAYSKQHPAAVLSKSLGASAAPAPAADHGALGPGAGPADGRPAVRAGNLYDGHGNMVGVVPDRYAAAPGLYIPPPEVTYA